MTDRSKTLEVIFTAIDEQFGEVISQPGIREIAALALTAYESHLQASGMAVVDVQILSRLGVLAARMQARVDVIEERDGDKAVTGPGVGISYLLAKSIADTCQAASAAVSPYGKAEPKDEMGAEGEARSTHNHPQEKDA